ncbi:MAG TPA: hypothetical protein VH858_05210, partial [Hyphomicrobiales bacterium]
DIAASPPSACSEIDISVRTRASWIMRTTIDIDDPILEQLKRLQRRERKSLGRLVSDLLAQSLATSRTRRPGAPQLEWIAKIHGRSGRSHRQARHARCNGPVGAVSYAIDVNVLLYASDADSPMLPAACAKCVRADTGQRKYERE